MLAHAVTDAVLGACVHVRHRGALPLRRPALAGADTIDLLGQAAVMAVAAGWQIKHVDVTVIVEDVRIAPHRDEIRANLARALGSFPIWSR